jgi:muramoyltetrapeptide carboxypeptidase LdcA involved in peptidoglycan recycling
MKQFKNLAKLKPGDKVSIISPSAGLAGMFPWMFELGLQRLRDDFGLVPVEYPTTRELQASLEERAKDIMSAFADAQTKAVIAAIGGSDQIKLLKYLDKQVFLDNPKPFFGFSDNTHLGNYLWNLGIPSFYGSCVLTQFAYGDAIPAFTAEYIRHALFDSGEFELRWSEVYNDIGNNWSDKTSMSKPRITEPNEPWAWDGEQDAEGVLWGGCVESLIVQATAQIYMPSDADLEGAILFIETAEDIPDHWVLEYLLTGFGERGWFDKFQAVLVGRPKAWEFDKQNDTEQKSTYRKQQRETVLKVVREYNQTIPIIQNLDFGHTDPQVAVPKGGKVRIDNAQKKIYLSY